MLTSNGNKNLKRTYLVGPVGWDCVSAASPSPQAFDRFIFKQI